MTQTNTRLTKPYHAYMTRLLWLAFCILLAYFYFIAMEQYVEKLSTALPLTVPSSNLLFTLSEMGIPATISRSILIAWTWLVIVIGYISSAFIVWKRGDDWVAVGTAIGLLYVGRIALVYDYTSSPADYIPSVMSAIYITVLLVFPNGQLKPRWSLFIPLWGFIAELPLELMIGDLSGVTEFIRTAYPIPLILVLIYRHRRVLIQEAKQQSKWLFVLIFVLALGQVLYSLPEIIAPGDAWLIGNIMRGAGETLYYIGATTAPIAILFAMLRYHLWDIDLFINRTLVYGTVALLVMILFFTISAGSQMAFGNTRPFFAFIISAALSVGFFRPVRNQTQHLIDRYIYRLRFDLNELERHQTLPTITNPGKLTGQQIGDYEIKGVIGKGGMGEVYEGTGMGKRVAIKTMLAELARDPDFRNRFEREAEAGQRLQHPGIIPVFDSGEMDGIPYLVMEYVEGKELSKSFKGGGMFTVETSCHIMRDLCSALTVVHDAGYVHRDIKPSNIMLRDNGRAILMDFGISKVQDAREITGTEAIGTIHYMAPEQIKSSKDVEHHADIYALGCVLYTMLTSETPFGGTVVQVMFAQINQPAPDPRDIQDDIPDFIAEIILKAMEKDPGDRFTSAEKFAEALQNLE